MLPKETTSFVRKPPFLKQSHAAVLGAVRILALDFSAHGSWLGRSDEGALRTQRCLQMLPQLGVSRSDLDLLAVCLTGWSPGSCVIIQPQRQSSGRCPKKDNLILYPALFWVPTLCGLPFAGWGCSKSMQKRVWEDAVALGRLALDPHFSDLLCHASMLDFPRQCLVLPLVSLFRRSNSHMHSNAALEWLFSLYTCSACLRGCWFLPA